MKFLNSKIFNYILIETAILILIIKAYYINTIFIDDSSTFYYRVFQTIAHDSFIYFLITLLIYISYQRFILYYLGILLRGISVILFLSYLIDIYILHNFANHLVLNDVIKYITYAPKYINQLYNLNIFYLFIFYY